MTPTRQAYNSAGESTLPERRGVSGRRVIEEARAKVSVLELAEHLGAELKPSGKELRGCCPIHGGDNPTSFVVDAEAGRWHCFSCLRGGDVIELARYAWNYERHEAPMAGADLLHTFHHSLPSRPPSWFQRQARQAPIRAAVEQARRNVYIRRLYNYLILPALQGIEDDHEYVRELEQTWREFEELLS